jgi:hypothetical protein
MEVDEKYQEAKNKYDKVTISLDMDKQALEKDCDACQVGSLLTSPILCPCFVLCVISCFVHCRRNVYELNQDITF